jgi:PAS domain S-box-containing protein
MISKQNPMLENPFIAYAHYRIILDASGTPYDYEYLEVNSPFEKLSGLKKEDLHHHTVRETLPHILGSSFDWIATFGQIALEGGEKVFEYHNLVTDKWYRVHVFSSEKMYFTSMYLDITETKKQAEELEQQQKVLKESEAQLRELLLALPFGVVIIDPLTRNIEQVNDHISELFGADKNQLLGHRCHHFLCPADEGACPVCDLGKTVDNSERVMLRVDGSRLPILKTVKRVSLGGQDKLLECFVDISDRKRSEELIKLRLTLMEFAASHTLDELLQKTLDEVGRISDSPIGFYHFVNEDQKTLSLQAWSTRTLQEFCKAEAKGFHYSIDQAGVWVDCVRSKQAVIHNDYNSLPHRKGLPQGHAPVIREMVVPVIRNNQIKAILGVGNKPSLYTDKDLELVAYLADICWDIVEQKQIAEILHKNYQFQKIISDISSNFVKTTNSTFDKDIKQMLSQIGTFFQVDRSYLFLFSEDYTTMTNTHEWCANGVSPQMQAIQQYPMSALPWHKQKILYTELIHIPEVDMLPPEAYAEKEEFKRQEIKSLINIAVRSSKKIWGFIGFDAVKKSYTWSQNEIDNLQVIVNILGDLLLKLETENHLKAAKKAAEIASKAKSLFLANMSHEIRTPLNGVIGFTDLLKNTPLSPVQQQYVENANISGHTLLGIINDILDFSKIEAGMMNLEVIKTDMIELLENSIDIIKYSACKKELEVLLSIDQNMPRFAMTDPIRLKQILANLLSNAVKFTEKGEIELKVHFSSAEDNKGKFTFYVRDTGIGISDNQKEKLFKSFSQADNSTTRKYGGTGLGLSISQMIVEKMGGHIFIESQQGEGSTFYFDLQTEVEDGDKMDVSSIKNIKRCLVIDDNSNNRLILQRMLDSWNITSESCENGFDALKTLEKSKPFDLIICDYHMPYLDGLETIKMIRDKLKLSPEKQAIILLHSSSDDAELHKKCDELGILFRLTKPVKSDDLFKYLCSIHDPAKLSQRNQTEKVTSEASKSQLSILIAEDIEMNMLMIKALLGQLYPETTIIEASNGIEAVDLYKSKQINLILMDIQMPLMDGVQASKAIRKIEESSGKHIPIVALTAGALKEEREACLAAGMDAFLSKPVDIEELKKTIAQNIPSEVLNQSLDSFDRNALMKRVGDNLSLYCSFLETSKNMPEKLEKLHLAIQQKEEIEVKRLAHSIKGVASMLSFVKLASLAEQMENLDLYNLEILQSLMKEQFEEWSKLKPEIDSELAKFAQN